MTAALAELHQDLQDLVGQTIAERYRVDSLLGIGGMAAVFKAHHLGLKRDVAVKVLHPNLTRHPELSARFEREAESASRLDHPNCVQVTDFGSTKSGVKYMVMQLLEGGELQSILRKALPPLRTVELGLQILRGLEHAHRQGVVHRDVKPENVFITRDHEGREVLKLVDFGISKIVGGASDRHKTSAGLVFGTPAYMSPEQAAGLEADNRADLYSVGIIMYQMLAGRLPFDSEDPVALVRMQVGRDPDPLPSSVPPVLAGVVGRLLEKDREARYQSGAEVIAALEGIRPMLGGIPAPTGGSPSTGPIDLYASQSEPISIITGPQPMHHTLTGHPSMNESPSMVLGSVRRARPRWMWPAAVGAVVLLVFAAVSVAMDGSDGDGVASTAGSLWPGSDKEEIEEEEVLIGAGASTLQQVDKLILAGELEEADKILGPLRDEFPGDPALVWRHGRLLAKRRGKAGQALAAYGEAMTMDPELLDDKDFYAEVYELLRRRPVRDQALDLALQKMGPHGHKFLLELVNEDRRPLGYSDRQRALAELRKDLENIPLINRKLNMALDLLQAGESREPCTAYRNALGAIAAEPDYFFHRRVEKAAVPDAAGADEDASACEGIAERREEVLAMLAAIAPSPDDDGAEGGEGTPARAIGATDSKPPSNTRSSGSSKAKNSKKAKTSSNSKKSDCSKFGGVFKKDCW